jgi:hypothetical protein
MNLVWLGCFVVGVFAVALGVGYADKLEALVRKVFSRKK